MNKVLNLFFCLVVFPLLTIAQNSGEFGIKFSGFVKSDIIYDSRQTVNLREGHFLLYPAHVSLDKSGIDVNAIPNFNILSIQSRLAGTITGPNVGKCKSSAYLEAEFFGHSEADINGFRLRHAWVKLANEKSELMVGQFWHPMFITESFPEVVSFNTGAPFHAFARNPQIRMLNKFGTLQLISTIYTQRDFSSPGGSNSLRNSGIPALNFKIQNYKKDSEKNTELLTGASINYMSLLPRLVSAQGYQTKQRVNSLSYNAYFKIKIPAFTFKLEATYGQNLFDLVMLGGYAYKFTDDTNIINKGLFEYTTIDNLAAWTEIMSNGKKFQYGLFAAYSKNLGSLSNIYNWNKPESYFSRGGNIDYLYRISPRFVYNEGKFRFGAEIEYTVAAYGSLPNNNSRGQVQNATTISNIRGLLGVFYFF